MGNHSIAELAKEKGNVAFKAEDYAIARSLYSHAIAFDKSNHFYPLNRSLANLKLARWEDAEADTTKTLDLSPRNLKAFFRRGLARKGLGKLDQARKDIQMFIDSGGDPTLGAQEFKVIADVENLARSEPSSFTSSDLDNDLANLHLQDNSSFFTIRTSKVVPDGKGAFASRDIQRGDLILSERPTFSTPTSAPDRLKYISIEDAVRNLSPSHLNHFLSLHNSHTDCSCFPNPLIGIFGTNAFGVGDNSGICLRASRFNHSCSPNAKFSFNSNTGELRIYALGAISLGEEIFIACISGGRLIYGSPRRSRQALLRAEHHFTCACSVCSLPEAESKKSDARRVKVNEIWEMTQSFIPTQGFQRFHLILKDIVKAIHLLKEEGFLADADEFTDEAGFVCACHSDWVSAKYWAGLTYHTRVAEFGEDSPRAAEVRGQFLNPKSFPLAGCGPPKNLTALRL